MVPDGIHPRTLKKLPDVIMTPSMIFQLSWESRKVPIDWKLANEAATDLFSLVITDRTEGNCLMLCQSRFRLGIRRRFFT